ncbi:MAG: zonular occludens toxin domain-containing protein [Desulfobulbus sp.]|nr:zonular occludens toxin domain-containing protein [Desulfobulbus sp.]
MITIITGVPGAGKSYLAVSTAIDFKRKGRALVHNLRGFDGCNDSLDLLAIALSPPSGSVIFLDECQDFIPAGSRIDPRISHFFETHRHHGIDIFLITQDFKKVHPAISCLAEVTFRASSPSGNPFPFLFTYSKEIGGETVSRFFRFRRKSVFSSYVSAFQHQKRFPLSFAAGLAIAVFVFGAGVYWRFHSTTNNLRSGGDPGPTSSVRPGTSSTSRPLPPSSSRPGPSGGNPVTDLNLVRVSSVTDPTGTYYLYLGALIRSDFFPHKLYKAKTGTYILVSDSEAAKIRAYQDSIPERPPEQPERTEGKGSAPDPAPDRERGGRPA